MRINLYTQNHQSTQGIEDFVDFLKSMFSSRGIEVIQSDELKSNAINIVIDEFTSSYQTHYLLEFKKHSNNAPIVLVMTEFIESKLLATSFNYFGGVFSHLFIPSYNVYVRLLRQDFERPGFTDFVKSAITFPLALPAFLAWQILSALHNMRPNWKVISRMGTLKHQLSVMAYMHRRYLGFMKIIGSVDAVILTHDAMKTSLQAVLAKKKGVRPKFVEVFYPQFSINTENDFLRGRDLSFEITGSVTPFRLKWIRKFSRTVSSYDLFQFSDPIIKSFGSTLVDRQRSAFSIHPPQTKWWPYSSPMRLFRALQKDRNIPILTKKYGDSPIEEVCLLYDGLELFHKMHDLYSDENMLRDYLNEKLSQYESAVNPRNDRLVDEVRKLGTPQPTNTY